MGDLTSFLSTLFPASFRPASALTNAAKMSATDVRHLIVVSLWLFIRGRSFLCAVRRRLLLALWMKVLLRRTLIDGEAALATMNRVAGCSFLFHFIWSRQPLLNMSLT